MQQYGLLVPSWLWQDAVRVSLMPILPLLQRRWLKEHGDGPQLRKARENVACRPGARAPFNCCKLIHKQGRWAWVALTGNHNWSAKAC
jgi:hypothetical protein